MLTRARENPLKRRRRRKKEEKIDLKRSVNISNKPQKHFYFDFFFFHVCCLFSMCVYPKKSKKTRKSKDYHNFYNINVL
jgi:hypothetical protein